MEKLVESTPQKTYKHKTKVQYNGNLAVDDSASAVSDGECRDIDDEVFQSALASHTQNSLDEISTESSENI